MASKMYSHNIYYHTGPRALYMVIECNVTKVIDPLIIYRHKKKRRKIFLANCLFVHVMALVKHPMTFN